MKRKMAWMVRVGVLLLGVALTLYGSDNSWIQDYAISSTPEFTLNHLEPTHTVGRFQFPLLSEQDTFVSYVYTYGDIVIFSYEDSSEFEVVDRNGESVWSGLLMRDEYAHVSNLTSSQVYEVVGSKEFSILSGDPFLEGLGCWFAVDEHSRPLSTKLLSVGPKMSSISDEVIVVFAYHDGTYVVVTDLGTDEVIWEGDLDSAEYYVRDTLGPIVIFSVESTKPVSAVTLSGVVGTYAPAFNGTFTGHDFMTYCHDWTEGPQDLNIIPWEDNTTVTITDLDNQDDTIWQEEFENRGVIKGQAMPEDRALYIHADKDISISQTPWASFGGTTIAFYLARGIDRDGLGLGKEFYIPVERSFPGYDSRLQVISFEDNTDVKVSRIPRYGGDETDIWQGVLNRGEFYHYTTPTDENGHAIYHVTSSEPVAALGSCFGMRGSDFSPVVNLAALGISEEPPVTPATPVTHPLNWQVLTPVGQQITLQYSESPQGFHASVFGATGCKVDELHSSEQSGMIIWGQCYGPGVYFIRADNKAGYTQKVVLVK